MPHHCPKAKTTPARCLAQRDQKLYAPDVVHASCPSLQGRQAVRLLEEPAASALPESLCRPQTLCQGAVHDSGRTHDIRFPHLLTALPARAWKVCAASALQRIFSVNHLRQRRRTARPVERRVLSGPLCAKKPRLSSGLFSCRAICRFSETTDSATLSGDLRASGDRSRRTCSSSRSGRWAPRCRAWQPP